LPLLKEFNDEPVLNMRDLREKVMAVEEGFLHFLLGEGKSIIFDAKACREAEDEIFQTCVIICKHVLMSDVAFCPPAPSYL
jgi:hypothetical protein